MALRFWWLLIALWCGLALTGVGARAQPSPGPDATLDALRQQLETARKRVEAKPADSELPALRAAALAAQTQAGDMAEQLAPQLTSVEARLAELGTVAAGATEDRDLAAQRAALNRGRTLLDGQVKLARLLAVEAEQLAGDVWTLRRSQFQARLGERTDSVLSPPFWNELLDDWPRDAARLRVLGAEFARVAGDTPLAVWLALPLVVAGAYAVLWWARRRAIDWITHKAPPGRLRRSLRALVVLAHQTLAVGALATAASAALNWRDGLSPPSAMLLEHSTGALWFVGYLGGLFGALVCAKRPSWRLVPIPDDIAVSLRWFAPQIATLSFVAWLLARLAVTVNASLAMTVAINFVVALALALVLGLAMLRAERAWRRALLAQRAPERPAWRAVLVGASWVVLVGVVVCLLAGYVAFGSFAVKQMVWAGVVVGSASLLAALVDDVLMAACAQHAGREAESRPGAAAPAAPNPYLVQLAVLASGVLRLAVLLFALMLLIAPFGEGPTDLLRRGVHWQEGLAIGEIKLQPGALLQAVLVLGGGLLAVRLLRSWMAERYLPTTSLDPGMRASATTLFGYAGVVIAVSLSMSAIGIGLERVAWVASALSVGIGFGLQAVVQNFVSGLILLAERPVKVGDWVSLGGVEGDIRRINVRATEIQMGDRSTVIVPNSEFITKVVRNVTLADPLGLVQLKLPVPLGTDPNRVRELMLAAFAAEPAVLDEPAPNVLLDGVDAGNLLFNATGFVASPRLSGGVRSALLFDVLARLHDAGIELSRAPTVLLRDGPAAAPAEPSPHPLAGPAGAD